MKNFKGKVNTIFYFIVRFTNMVEICVFTQKIWFSISENQI